MTDLLTELQAAYTAQQRAALCIVVNTKGSSPQKSGAKMIVYEDGTIRGTIGGGALEMTVISDALKVIKTNKPTLIRHDLLHNHRMCCGGTMDIYIEPLERKDPLYIFGAGHTGQALATLARHFNFEIFLIDSRTEYLGQLTDEYVNKINLSYDAALKALPFSACTYTCIMTHDHAIDRQILSCAIQMPFAYLGMIGSQRKCEITKKILKEGLSISDELLSRIDMPMGVSIGAQGPFEIAASILAALIKAKRGTTTCSKYI